MNGVARFANAVVQTSMAIVLTIGTAYAAAPPQCASRPVIHKNGTVDFEDKTYRIDTELKAVLITYHKQHANCVMTNLVTEPDTSVSVTGKVILLLAETGLLPEKAGFLIEPRQTP